MNVHLNYKTISSWRILFQSGGRPRQFSRPECFRALVIPGGVFSKGTILQGRQIKRRFSCGRPVMPDNKRGYNGSNCTCTQTDEYNVCKDIQTVNLQDQMTRIPALANPSIRTTPPRNLFSSPLHPPGLPRFPVRDGEGSARRDLTL